VMWIVHSKVYIQSGIQSCVYHNLYIRQVESVSVRVRCPIRSSVSSGVQHTYMYQAKTINYSTLWTVYYYYYVSEYQLPPVIDASHTTPITHVNKGPKLLKLIGWRHCPCFRWIPYIPETTAQTPGAEPGPTAS